MSDNEMWRGDTKSWTITLTNTETDGPLDLRNKRVTETCRSKPAKPANPADGLIYSHFLEIDGSGNVVASDGMEMVGTPEDGVVKHTITSVESATFPPTTRTPLSWDLEVRTRDAVPVVVTTMSGTLTVKGDYSLPPE